QAARLLRVDLEAFEGLVANVFRVLDPRARTLTEGVLAERARQVEMTLRVAWVDLHRATRIELRGFVVGFTLGVIAFIGPEIDRRPRRLPERLVVFGVELDRLLVVLERSGSV